MRAIHNATTAPDDGGRDPSPFTHQAADAARIAPTSLQENYRRSKRALDIGRADRRTALPDGACRLIWQLAFTLQAARGGCFRHGLVKRLTDVQRVLPQADPRRWS